MPLHRLGEYQVPLLHVIRRPAGVEHETLTDVAAVRRCIVGWNNLRVRHFVRVDLSSVGNIHSITSLKLVDLAEDLREG